MKILSSPISPGSLPSGPMSDTERDHWMRGFWVTSLGTLASRVLGMLRDVATAALLGLGGGTMDALVLAFRLPNLSRRLFGEGALTACYLPVVSRHLEHDRPAAWQLASALLAVLSVGLALLVLLGEVGCGCVLYLAGDAPQLRLAAGLSAVLLPYALLVCVSAQLSATLEACSRFSLSAATSVVLNLIWLAAAWLVALWLVTTPAARAYLLAGAVLVAGVVQVAMQWAGLRRLGFRWHWNWRASREPLGQMAGALGPLVLAASVTQLNVVVDTLLAWGLAASAAGPAAIAWLPWAIDAPLRSGAAAALYCGERLYQLPVGLLGVAIATAIFPRLSRHAALARPDRLAADLTLALRWATFTSLPACLGLMLLAQPLVRLLFVHGAFSSADAVRASAAVVGYAAGIWAYCLVPIVLRGFFAVGDRRIPWRASCLALALNVGFDLLLVWPFGELGLAAATAIAAAAQAVVLVAAFSRVHARLDWRALCGTTVQTAFASLALVAAVLGVRQSLAGGGGLLADVVEISLATLAGAAAYLLIAGALGMDEFALLRPRSWRLQARTGETPLTQPTELSRAA